MIPEQSPAAVHRAAFAREHGASEGQWSAHNLARLLRSTGCRPQYVLRLRQALCTLSLTPLSDWPAPLGAFDHGTLWFRAGRPWALVGHPYAVSEGELALLRRMADAFDALAVFVDDRPSFYGHETRHIRVEVPRPRPVWRAARNVHCASVLETRP